eukprot:CFRG6340T1
MAGPGLPTYSENIFNEPKLETLEELYDVKKKLGTGGFSTVHLATYKPTNTMVALKKIIKKNNVSPEVNILSKLRHPNIILLYNFFWNDSHFYMSFEYVTGGSLSDLIVDIQMGYEEVCEEDWIHMLRDVVDGLKYAHSQGIAHRDIKSANVLFEIVDDRRSAKLIDWGLAATNTDLPCNNVRCGTPHYTAPEVLDVDREEGFVGTHADVWSLGVLFYECFREGIFPFKGRTAVEIFSSIQAGRYKPLTEDDVKSPVIRSIVKAMLSPNPHDRPTLKFVSLRMPRPPSLLPTSLTLHKSRRNSQSVSSMPNRVVCEENALSKDIHRGETINAISTMTECLEGSMTRRDTDVQQVWDGVQQLHII